MDTNSKQEIVVIGGGPGGYSAALSAAYLGAKVTLIEDVGIGGSAVLTDVVPSKTLIASAVSALSVEHVRGLGVSAGQLGDGKVLVDFARINRRIKDLARKQSQDMLKNLEKAQVTVLHGKGRLEGAKSVVVQLNDGGIRSLSPHTVVLAVGASPRVLPTAQPDGKRILTWKQLYDLENIPEHLIVVGSGVTGAEFASAFRALGAQVTLVSSRDQVLPGEDQDAANLIQEVFTRSGMNLLNNSRAKSARSTDSGVVITLNDGREVSGSHCLMAVGAVPNTRYLGLDSVGVQVDKNARIKVNRVACSNVPGIYAVGDCSEFLPLASVAEMQGQTAVFHALGENALPIRPSNLAANIFTTPEIASVGCSQKDIDEGRVRGVCQKLDLSTNPRAKMIDIKDGFIKLMVTPETGTIIGGVVVAPIASELIFPIAVAVQNRLTTDDLAQSFAIYPSLTLSIWHLSRALHVSQEG